MRATTSTFKPSVNSDFNISISRVVYNVNVTKYIVDVKDSRGCPVESITVDTTERKAALEVAADLHKIWN